MVVTFNTGSSTDLEVGPVEKGMLLEFIGTGGKQVTGNVIQTPGFRAGEVVTSYHVQVLTEEGKPGPVSIITPEDVGRNVLFLATKDSTAEQLLFDPSPYTEQPQMELAV